MLSKLLEGFNDIVTETAGWWMVHIVFVHTIHSSERRVVLVVSAIILHPNDCHVLHYICL